MFGLMRVQPAVSSQQPRSPEERREREEREKREREREKREKREREERDSTCGVWVLVCSVAVSFKGPLSNG